MERGRGPTMRRHHCRRARSGTAPRGACACLPSPSPGPRPSTSPSPVWRPQCSLVCVCVCVCNVVDVLTASLFAAWLNGLGDEPCYHLDRLRNDKRPVVFSDDYDQNWWGLERYALLVLAALLRDRSQPAHTATLGGCCQAAASAADAAGSQVSLRGGAGPGREGRHPG
jgi:hypothetical protein